MNFLLFRATLLSAVACVASYACQAQYTAHDFSKFQNRSRRVDYNKAKAAGKNLTGFLRSEDAFSYIFTSFKYEQSFSSRDFQTGEVRHDTSFSLDLRPKISFGVTGSSSRPICDFGDNAALLFSYGIAFNYFKLETDSLHLGNNYHSYGIYAVQGGLPLTIDYKTGCEATLDKSKGTMMGFGVGLIPTLNYAVINLKDASTSFKVYPYAKVEVGVFWKICMKLRASCQLGKYNFLQLDNYGSSHYDKNAISLKSGPIYSLSLVLMPLSFDWNEEGGW